MKFYRTCKVITISQIKIPRHFKKINKYLKKYEKCNWVADKRERNSFNINKLRPDGYEITLWKDIPITSDLKEFTESDVDLLKKLREDFPEIVLGVEPSDTSFERCIIIGDRKLVVRWDEFPTKPSYLSDKDEINFYDIIYYKVSEFIKKRSEPNAN